MLAGRDMQAQGTWLGVTPTGRVAFLTNLREVGGPGRNREGWQWFILELLIKQHQWSECHQWRKLARRACQRRKGAMALNMGAQCCAQLNAVSPGGPERCCSRQKGKTRRQAHSHSACLQHQHGQRQDTQGPASLLVALLAVSLRFKTCYCWMPAALSQRDPDPDSSDGPSRHASRGSLTTGFLLGKQRPLEYLQVHPVAHCRWGEG